MRIFSAESEKAQGDLRSSQHAAVAGGAEGGREGRLISQNTKRKQMTGE